MKNNALAVIRSNPFWSYKIAGWSIWFGLLVAGTFAFEPSSYLFARSLGYFYIAVLGFILTSGLRYLFLFVSRFRVIVRSLICFLSILIASILWPVLIVTVGRVVPLDWAGLASSGVIPTEPFDNIVNLTYPVFYIWGGLYFVIKLMLLLQVEREKVLLSTALANQAQLSMLRYQLNPHFLFNTLNAISTLVLDKATQQANEMLTKLSKFLRYSLDHSPLDRVTLANELETSQLYLDIEKVRFADRLRLQFNIDADVGEAQVPTLLLQPIIENSIKHGISKSEDGGIIAITAQRKEGNRLLIEVIDDGPGVPDNEIIGQKFQPSKGVGISNIRNRLQEIYGESYELIFTNAEPRGLRVTILIPYERN